MSETPRIYFDAYGHPIDLVRLVKAEPEWAANQIRHRDRLQADLAAAQSARVEAEVERDIANGLKAEAEKERRLAHYDFISLAQEIHSIHSFLQREGYRRCDIPECNCGEWHKRKEYGR